MIIYLVAGIFRINKISIKVRMYVSLYFFSILNSIAYWLIGLPFTGIVIEQSSFNWHVISFGNIVLTNFGDSLKELKQSFFFISGLKKILQIKTECDNFFLHLSNRLSAEVLEQDSLGWKIITYYA